MSKDIIDPLDSADSDVRDIQFRRMFQYSAEALKVGKEVEQKYVLLPQLRVALTALDRAFQLALKIGSPQGVLIYGPPGSSKTTIANYFCQSLPPNHNIVDGFGALMIRLHSRPSAETLVATLLRSLKHPFPRVRRSNVEQMREIMIEALRNRGTRLIVIDQAHALAQATQYQVRNKSFASESSASETLRDLMDETGVALAFLASTTFPGLESIDESLADRVTTKINLSHFGNDHHWIQFNEQIAKNVKGVSLKLLTSRRVLELVHMATQGNRRRYMLLISEAALVARDDQKDTVTEVHLRVAFFRVFGASSPDSNPFSDRDPAEH